MSPDVLKNTVILTCPELLVLLEVGGGGVIQLLAAVRPGRVSREGTPSIETLLFG